jgi:uncharacterized repeat protein (TIGR01451 family)
MPLMPTFQGHCARAWRGLAAVALACVAFPWLLGGAAPASAASVPAGTVIRNVASGTYIPAGLMQTEFVTSNAVIATVRPVEALSLTQDQTVSRPPGSVIALSHLLKNTGNVDSRYTLALVNNGGSCSADTADLGSLRVVRDVNGNGVVDGGEPELPLNAAGALRLEPAETVALLVQGNVPGTASGAACVALTATTSLQGVTATNRDTVNIGNMAVLTLTKAASHAGSSAPQGTRVDFSIRGTNIGAQDAQPANTVAPEGTPLRVNGAPSELVLIRDLVPTGMQYLAGTLQTSAANAIKLYRLPGDPPFNYRTAEDASAVEVAIGLRTPVARNASFSMQFAARVTASQSGDIRNTAQTYYHDGVRPTVVDSNTVVLASGGSIGIAKSAYPAQMLYGANGKPNGRVSVRFRLSVRNYGSTWLHGVQVTDLLEGAALNKFGRYSSSAQPATNEYTIVPGSLKVVGSAGQGVVAQANPLLKGTADAQNLLADGASLPPGGLLILEFDAIVNFTGNIGVRFNTAKASAALFAGGPSTVSDDSVDGNDPDLDGDGNPGNDTSPTPVRFAMPALELSKQASAPREVSPGVHEWDYTLKVTNTGAVDAPNVRLIDNLDCTFDMDKSDGRIASWTLVGAPKTANGNLVAAANFTGRAACDRDAVESIDPYRFPSQVALSLTDGSRSLAPGQSEEVRFSVRVTEKPGGTGRRVTLDNKAWAAALVQNNPGSGSTVAAAMATSRTLLVKPQGTVYNAATREPVSGAVVTFTRQTCSAGAAGPITAAEIFASDSGLYTFNANGSVSMTTGADGTYQFYLMAPPISGLCTYGLAVSPPAGSGYVVPSQLIPATGGTASCGPVVPSATPPVGADPTTHYFQLRAGVNPDGSFCEPVHNHLPLDPGNVLGLVLRKDGSKRQAEFGDFLDYALTVTNKTGFPITGLTLSDNLPPGFAYQRGSARLNGAATPDPAGGAGPALVFHYPQLSLPPEQSAMVRYRVRIGVGAPTEGDAINRARANAGPVQSNLASWRVRVTGGVFSDEAFLFGKVYMDCQRDGRQHGSDEIGVPGVRLYLENGTHVITDVEGKWSLYGLKPITHVLRLDQTTLPPGAKLGVLDNRNAGTPESRFVDLKKGELHKANFLITNCADQGVIDDVVARRAAIAAVPDTEAEAQVRLRLDPEGRVVPVGDVRALPASGQTLASGSTGTVQPTSAPLITLPTGPANGSTFVNASGGTLGGTLGAQTTGGAPLGTQAVPVPARVGALANTPLPAPLPAPEPSPAAPAAVELEKLLPEFTDNSLGFVDLKNGSIVASRTLNVRVKGGDGTFRLSVNGAQIEERRVGKKARLPSKQLAAWEYIGIVLRPGANTLRLEALDGFGNVRGAPVEIVLIAPDNLAAIELGLPQNVRADLRTPVVVKVRLLDGAGVPVTARTQLTLEADRGRWQAEDLNPLEPGTQVFMEGGAAEFNLQPPGEPGDARIRVSASSFASEARLVFLPELRPMIGVGIVEGVIDLTKRGNLPLGAMPAGAAFERELTGLQSEGSNNNRRTAGRAAFFFKGAIKGEYLLTAAYDSDKTERDRLFRDIRPDEFYPIYGDSAVKGFDAQSSQKLYVRIDKNRSYLLYGDFTTASSTEVRELSQSNRTLTGLKHVYESERVRATSYASRTAQVQQIEEFRALGTSGPYYLSAAGGEFVENSEQVEIVVRDRNQPDIVLQRTPVTRFVDYTVEPLTRRILFTRAIASIDPNLNPQSIRVTYEVDSGGPEFTVAGIDVQMKLNDAVQVGAVASTDRNPANKRQLQALTGLARVGENASIAGEVVQTRSDDKGRGQGARVEARYQNDKLAVVGLAARTSEGFDNPGSSFSAGRTAASTRAEYRIDPSLAVRAEALYSRDLAQEGDRKGVTVSAQKKLGETTTLEVGLRHGQSNDAIGTNSGFDYGQISTYNGQLGSSIGANSVTTLGAAAATDSADARSLTTVRARLSTQLAAVPGAQVFVEGEQDIHDSDRRVFAVGGNYALSDKTRVYGRYELISSLYGPYELDGGQRNNVGIVGIESNYMPGGRVYNEYRISDGAEGRGVQSAIGVRNTVSLTERLRVTGGIEHARDLSGYSNSVNSGTGFAGGLGESTAITSGVEYLTDRLKTSGVFEARNGDDANTRLFSAGFGYKFDPSWSLLARSIVSTSEGRGANAGNERHLQRHQIGVAYRPVDDDTWNALARYEHRAERVVGEGNAAGALVGGAVFGAGNGNASLPGKTSADIVSAHVNYNPERGRYLMGRYAGKVSRARDDLLASSYWAHLLQLRYTQDINRDWDIGVQGGLLFGKGGGLQKTFGLELGYQIYKNAWVSVGYNFIGLHDRDLTANEYTSKGAYIRLRFKFDETTLGFPSAGGAAPTASATQQ